jgi:glycolate oxidase FAD binding subunit
MSSVTQDFVRLLGTTAVVDWETTDFSLKAQIAQAIAPNSSLQCVVYPSTPEQLSEAVACAARNHWRLLVCGSGSKLHWGGLADGIQVVISTARLNRLIEFASGDLTVTVESGLKLADLQSKLAEAGQFLPIDQAYPMQATLGGIVATADTGALRQRYGGLRDLLIGLTLVRSDGQLAKAGGRVVKNVAGSDLMKLFTGSYGTLGILSQLSLRIYPIPAASTTLFVTGSQIAPFTAQLLASGLTPTAIEILAASTVEHLELGQQLGLLIRFQAIEVSVMQQVAQVKQLAEQLGLSTTQIRSADEVALWQQLRHLLDHPPPEMPLTCKIGVEPAQSVAVLNQVFNQLEQAGAGGVIHAGSGLGNLYLPPISAATLLNLRQIVQAAGGFLSVLSAPEALKQHIDIWGYTGDALGIMRQIKSQFDPENLLSPQRFVGKI